MLHEVNIDIGLQDSNTRVLWWIGMPYQKGELRQWFVQIILKTPQGKFELFTIPWTILPLLRLGQFWHGNALGRHNNGQSIKLRIDTAAPIRIMKFQHLALKYDYYLPKAEFYRQEVLVLKTTTERLVIVPIVEVLRAFFASSSWLAIRMLEPQALQLIIDNIVQDNASWHIFFNENISVNELKVNHKHLIGLMLHPNLKEAWKSIPGAFLQQPPHFSKRILPDLKPQWTVRGLPFGDRLLVLEIMHVTFRKGLKQSVVYYHPKLKEGNIEGKSTNLTMPSTEKSTLSTANHAGKRSRFSRSIAQGKLPFSTDDIVIQAFRKQKKQADRNVTLAIIPSHLEETLHLGDDAPEQQGKRGHIVQERSQGKPSDDKEIPEAFDSERWLNSLDVMAQGRYKQFQLGVETLGNFPDIYLVQKEMMIEHAAGKDSDGQIAYSYISVYKNERFLGALLEIIGTQQSSTSTLIIKLLTHDDIDNVFHQFVQVALSSQGRWLKLYLQHPQQVNKNIIAVSRKYHYQRKVFDEEKARKWAESVLQQLKGVETRR